MEYTIIKTAVHFVYFVSQGRWHPMNLKQIVSPADPTDYRRRRVHETHSVYSHGLIRLNVYMQN